jgi:hypothetical protein
MLLVSRLYSGIDNRLITENGAVGRMRIETFQFIYMSRPKMEDLENTLQELKEKRWRQRQNETQIRPRFLEITELRSEQGRLCSTE